MSTAVRRKRNSPNNPVKKEKEDSILSKKKNDVKEPLVSWRKLLGRFLFTVLILGVIFFSTMHKSVNEIIFASQRETIDRRSHRVNCSPDYDKEKHLASCLPKICGRVVTDTLITPEEAQQLLKLAKKGFSYGESDGGASILDLYSGALSMGRKFVNIYKNPEYANMFTEDDFKVYRNVKTKIQSTISMEFGAMPNDLYPTQPTFFSRITSKAAKTIHDEYWHPHVDKETYESFHYTSLLYLSNYGVTFSGGQFVFIDKNINATIEPKLGRLSMFTSGSENLHYVEKVVSGERFALTISFTCDKKFAIKQIGPK
uniref:Fe2OG dioxygenase domain-containing protein n=1 Tax=Strigamia maritima TaxID=126957 RepID=T1ISY3_STRMM